MAGDEAPTTEAACQDLVEILDEGSGRLDMGRYIDHVRDLWAGAIATFEGTMQDHFDGRRVVELCYEAYGSMARRQLEAILREARAAHAVPAGRGALPRDGPRWRGQRVRGGRRIWIWIREEMVGAGGSSVWGEKGREDRATWVILRGGGIDGCCWISEH
ncbi:Molybdopterin synthase catalytic subunit [Hordeum vulgare]|nr:Molybdopterin synthase catalytic subunit [Hordeum vulgare]